MPDSRSPHQITEQVRSLYEQFPFPGPYASSQQAVLDATVSYTWVCYQGLGVYRRPQGRRLLDAGCGSGETLLRYAVNNPGLSLTGYDLSAASLELARRKLDGVAGAEVTLEQRNLLDLPLPGRTFDLVSCTGVLHHLADPKRGLRNLVPYLAPDGLFSIYLYPQYLRREIAMVSRIVRLLCPEEEPLPERIGVARQLLSGLGPDHFLVDRRRIGFDTLAWVERDEHLADMYLHPQELTYTYEGVAELLDDAGLELVRFYDEPEWDLERLLPHPDLRERARTLPLHSRRILADLLNPRPAYIFLAARKGWARGPERGGDELPRLIPVLSPVVSFVQRRPALAYRNIPPETYVEVAEVPSRKYRLDPLSEAVLGWVDGQRTAAQVAACVVQQDKAGRVEPLMILQQISNLEREGVLMLAYPHELGGKGE